MAQFDVHRNPGKQRDSIPFVVIVQSSRFDTYRRRVVVPLVKQSALGALGHTDLNPCFTIAGETVVLHPLEIVSVAQENLGEFVVSLAHAGEQITQALDVLLTRAWH